MANTTQYHKLTPKPEENEDGLSKEMEDLLPTLPKEKGWRTPYLYNYQGLWSQPKEIQAIISTQQHFKAHDTDIILLSIPKSGTTWLKSLIFTVVNRANQSFAVKNHPLLNFNPHDLVPFLEYKIYANNQIVPDHLTSIPPPRLFASHMSYGLLPETIKTSKCKIVYISRNPLDCFVSLWHFVSKVRPKELGPFTIEEGFDSFCRGVSASGPFWDHVLGYWKASLESPDRVLFLRYEEMKEDDIPHVKRLAEFLGYPFSIEEEENGVIKEISKLCSFESLKELEPNKRGKSISMFDNDSLFRKGMVGDWANYLTSSMAERLIKIVQDKLEGTERIRNLSATDYAALAKAGQLASLLTQNPSSPGSPTVVFLSG